jgi:hypothetical protein
MCKKVISSENWIGEVHLYEGFCSSCSELKQESDISKGSTVEKLVNEAKQVEETIIPCETSHDSQLEIEMALLSNLTQKADDVLSHQGSINVFIKEIKDDLVDKAKERIEQSIQSFDVKKIEAQKVINYTEGIFDLISDYNDYMNDIINKLQDKPKMKVKNAIEKVYKDSMAILPKDIAKDVLLGKKAMLKTICNKATKSYDIYSYIEDINELTKKMALHPFHVIQEKLSTLPFYRAS